MVLLFFLCGEKNRRFSCSLVGKEIRKEKRERGKNSSKKLFKTHKTKKARAYISRETINTLTNHARAQQKKKQEQCARSWTNAWTIHRRTTSREIGSWGRLLPARRRRRRRTRNRLAFYITARETRRRWCSRQTLRIRADYRRIVRINTAITIR